MGGPDWACGLGPQEDRESIRTIRHAVERGLNWIDTAAVYGLGHSEEVVGRAVRGMPYNERPLVFTKCGLVWDEHQPMAEPRRSIAPDSIRRECDASLRRLGVDQIDLYQLHWPDAYDVPIEESWQTMLELKREGKARCIGVSNFDVPLLEACEALGHVDSLQPPFSLINRVAAAEVIPWCRENGTGVIVYSPMQSGLLSGRFTRARAELLRSDDWRNQLEEFQEPRLSRNLSLQDALRPMADRLDVTVAAVAVAWTLAWDGITGAIVGARAPEQVDDWLPAAHTRLSDGELTTLQGALEQTGAGEGATHPNNPPNAPRPDVSERRHG